MGVMKYLAVLATIIFAQDDGNPWGWDRKRRCDGDGYDPPCTICEGIGGLAWGDPNEDITITECEPVALPEELPIGVQTNFPIYPSRYTNLEYNLVISQKTNPSCFGGFPGPDSTDEHCYQNQTGYVNYDSYNNRVNLNYTFIPQDFLSQTFHVGPNMNILNHLAIDQCVCVDLGVGPFMPGWMNQTGSPFFPSGTRMLGRERIWVEWLEVYMVLDHFVLGPHHIWTDPNDDSKIIRLWQPWNALSVYDPTGWNYSDNSYLFTEVPPTACKARKGRWTIGCDENGLPESGFTLEKYNKY